MTFELEEEQCVGMNLSVFTIILHGLGSFTFGINSTHIENGAAFFTLPMNVSDPMMDVCTLRGMVYGGNDVGNSEPALILLPDGNQASSIYEYVSLCVCRLCSQTVQEHPTMIQYQPPEQQYLISLHPLQPHPLILLNHPRVILQWLF